MIPHGVDIYFGVEPIDLRWGFDRLCGIVSERIGRRPRSGRAGTPRGRGRGAWRSRSSRRLAVETAWSSLPTKSQFLRHGDAAQGALACVVVELQPAIFEEALQRRLVVLRVAERRA